MKQLYLHPSKEQLADRSWLLTILVVNEIPNEAVEGGYEEITVLKMELPSKDEPQIEHLDFT